MVDSSTLNRILAKFGSPYQVRVGSLTFNDYGDGSVTWTLFTNVGFVQPLSEKDEIVQLGMMNIGDARGYFRSDSDIKVGSIVRVLHQSLYWETVGDPIIYQVSGDQLVREILLRKVVD